MVRQSIKCPVQILFYANMDDSLVASGSRHHSGTGWLPGLPLVFGQARKIISLYHNTSDLQPKFKSEKI